MTTQGRGYGVFIGIWVGYEGRYNIRKMNGDTTRLRSIQKHTNADRVDEETK